MPKPRMKDCWMKLSDVRPTEHKARCLVFLNVDDPDQVQCVHVAEWWEVYEHPQGGFFTGSWSGYLYHCVGLPSGNVTHWMLLEHPQ